jgi:hypothetical protein
VFPWWRRRVCDGCLQMSCGRVQIWRYIAVSKLAPTGRDKTKQGQFLSKEAIWFCMQGGAGYLLCA